MPVPPAPGGVGRTRGHVPGSQCAHTSSGWTAPGTAPGSSPGPDVCCHPSNGGRVGPWAPGLPQEDLSPAVAGWHCDGHSSVLQRAWAEASSRGSRQGSVLEPTTGPPSLPLLATTLRCSGARTSTWVAARGLPGCPIHAPPTSSTPSASPASAYGISAPHLPDQHPSLAPLSTGQQAACPPPALRSLLLGVGPRCWCCPRPGPSLPAASEAARTSSPTELEGSGQLAPCVSRTGVQAKWALRWPLHGRVHVPSSQTLPSFWGGGAFGGPLPFFWALLVCPLHLPGSHRGEAAASHPGPRQPVLEAGAPRSPPEPPRLGLLHPTSSCPGTHQLLLSDVDQALLESPGRPPPPRGPGQRPGAASQQLELAVSWVGPKDTCPALSWPVHLTSQRGDKTTPASQGSDWPTYERWGQGSWCA